MSAILAERPAATDDSTPGLAIEAIKRGWPICSSPGADMAWWFPEPDDPGHEETTAYAKALCRQCPVQAGCLDLALAIDERYGIWGGLAEDERPRLGPWCPRCDAPVPAQRKHCGDLCAAEARTESRRDSDRRRAERINTARRDRRALLRTAQGPARVRGER
jgi:WhiB family redox-sensing transcriptional regulator